MLTLITNKLFHDAVLITFVSAINSLQCLSLIAGFCNSETALNDAIIFRTSASMLLYNSQGRTSLSNSIKRNEYLENFSCSV